MSLFEREGYKWRETYFVLFDAARRPSLAKLEKALGGLGGHFEVSEGVADEKGRFESLTIVAHDEFAAIDLSYTEGEEVTEQLPTLVEELRGSIADADERQKLAQIKKATARIDLLHFEEVGAEPPAESEEEEADELLDPSALIMVLDVVVHVTGGVAVDPQSGTLM